MKRYPEDAWERARKVQEVILRALAKRSSGWPAAEIIGLADRSLRRPVGALTPVALRAPAVSAPTARA